jgi:peptide/nickel transport system substrate-binding protein
MRIPVLHSPHAFSWVYDSNVVRQCNEYLTRTRPDGITVPFLLERWRPSEDLATWTLALRKGVKWSNGEDLVADHIIWNLRRWINPSVRSSLLDMLKGFLTADAIEKIDDWTVALHGRAPLLAVPEILFHYPALILHPQDEGRWSVGAIGTGAYEPAEIEVGGTAVLKRRDSYWRAAGWLDEIRFVDLGSDPQARLDALAAKRVDGLSDAGIEMLDRLAAMPDIRLHQVMTAHTAVARMKVGVKPFDDARVRRAFRLAIDPAAVLREAHRDLGAPGEHHHVAPVHPDYAALPPIRRDVAAARALLAEAGYPDGLAVELHCRQDLAWEAAACRVMAGQWAEAGIAVTLAVLPGEQYWKVWKDVPFGFTAWVHRPLAVTTLGLAYRGGAALNESGYANPKFDELLSRAESIVDPERRAQVVRELELLMQEDGPIVQPLWRAGFHPFTTALRNYQPHPTEYYFFEDVWLEA